jgi:hypothetical protein
MRQIIVQKHGSGDKVFSDGAAGQGGCEKPCDGVELDDVFNWDAVLAAWSEIHDTS